MSDAYLNNFDVNIVLIFYFHQQKYTMNGSSVRFQHQLDQQLKNQYHEICFNPNKRQVLLRLAAEDNKKNQPSFTTEENQNGGQLNNRMLKHYMNSIYEHYGIEDPIKREFRLAKRSLDLTINASPQKSLNLTQVTQSDRLTRTKKKLINLKDSFKRDNSDIVYSSQLLNQDTSIRESGSPFNRSRMSRQIGYRTKEKIYFKTLPREEVVKQISKPIVKHQFVIENNGQSKVVIKFNNPEQYKPVRKEVPIVFRYCPMCEAPVLDYNIEHHENACKDIQKAYRMPYSEIEGIIMNKVRRLEEQISHQFLQKGEQRVSSQFTNLKESVKLWMEESSPPVLEKVKDQFQHFACGAYEKINKLNWFKRLYKTVAKRRSLESAFR